MERIKPQIGQVYPCGTVTGVLKAAGTNRSIRVEVSCAHCGTLFSERFATVRSGERRSCSCKQREAFRTHWANQAANVAPALRNEIFEHHELNGGYATALQFKISRYLATSVWLMERRRIESSQPAALIVATASKIESMSNAGVQRNLGYSQAYALAICRIARKLLRARPELASTGSGTSPAQDRLSQLMCNGISFALALALEPHPRSFRRLGELLRQELDRTKKSTFGWIYKALLNMSPDERKGYPQADQFMSICEYTFKQRATRRNKFITTWATNKSIEGYTEHEHHDQ